MTRSVNLNQSVRLRVMSGFFLVASENGCTGFNWFFFILSFCGILEVIKNSGTFPVLKKIESTGVTSVPTNVPVVLFASCLSWERRHAGAVSFCEVHQQSGVLLVEEFESTLKIEPTSTLTLNKSRHMTRQRLATVIHSKTQRLNDAETAAGRWTSLNHLVLFGPIWTSCNPVKAVETQSKPVWTD